MIQIRSMMYFITLMIYAGGSLADTFVAHCGFSDKPDKAPVQLSQCTFAQRQGHVTVQFSDGLQIDLTPVGDSPGNYTDGEGKAAYRRSGLGDSGIKFKLADTTLFVYWRIDKWSCDKVEMAGPDGCVLSYGALEFQVSATDSGSLNRLRIESQGLSVVEGKFDSEIDGSAYLVELADLDANGWPELYIYVSSAGSGSYGSLIAYAVNNGKSMTPIYLPPMSAEVSVGYQGHDEFAVVENRLARRFPVYLAGDINAQPSGGMRQLQYALIAGEAGWQLVVDRVVEF